MAAKVKLLLGDDDPKDEVKEQEKTNKQQGKEEPLDKSPLAL